MMEDNKRKQDIDSKTDMINKVFLVVVLATVVSLFIKPISQNMGMPKMPNNMIFNAFLVFCVAEIFVNRFVVWQGIIKIKKGVIDSEWPATHTGLLMSIGLGSMSSFICAIVIYHIMGESQKHAMILTGVGGLNYLNYLLLTVKIKEAVDNEKS